MKITIRTDDDMFGAAESSGLDRAECFANYQLLSEARILLAYPDATITWNVSRGTTGVQTRVSADDQAVEDNVLDLLNLVWSEAEWLPAAAQAMFGEHVG